MSENYPNEYNRYLFHKGENYHSYKFLGNHLFQKKEKKGVRFSLWAPNAKKISVIGDFNNWQSNIDEMKKIKNSGIWTIFINKAKAGDLYKYKITGPNNEIRIKADPYANYAEKKPNTASRVFNNNKYKWNDEKWIKKRNNFDPHKEAILIYELHLGSWIRDEENNYLNYREIADKLVDYIKKMGYTHIELLPIAEHPFDGSWGYQTTGYYAVTSRYGNPDDFKYLVDKCHQNNIGVIMDWVPGHFCKDDHGLRIFDGTPLYESEDPRRAENIQWDTLNFDFAQPEIWSFLISNAIYWLKEFHIDGIRADAVSNMIYLDYQKKDGQWAANKYGGNENLEAIAFLQKLNEVVFKEFPGTLMIAEESSAWPGVTSPTYHDGLGFNFKWNMGWMNDTLEYMEKDPLFRKGVHNKLTFSIMYTYSENYILPLSHDEVVHGKKSLLDKMPGEYWEKFANLRLLFGYMLAHPGKNLLFMGGEFGQFIEWNYKQELDWSLLEYEKHKKMSDYVKELNKFYLEEKALWLLDHKPEGFEWVEADDKDKSIISFLRFPYNQENHLLVICNFTPVFRENYQVGIPFYKKYEIVFNSDLEKYGGENTINQKLYSPFKKSCNSKPYSLKIDLPPLSILYLKINENTKEG
ncbi:MAG TPA: 1,4-alpha-glucan branching protein GlgB [Halanaerobiales bacterium]|nr:1,4-alpha-glucan branching protein GlgB [Halanaerobiales bacterium]